MIQFVKLNAQVLEQTDYPMVDGIIPHLSKHGHTDIAGQLIDILEDYQNALTNQVPAGDEL